ncbi:MAG: efflux RND transporter periplasmic adaptor subunit [Xenococcaceae cyanobacterium]
MVKVSTPLSKKLLGAALVLSFLTSACGGKEKAAGPQAIPVKLQVLETATLINSTDYVGTLEARQRVNLAPRIEGRILRIFVEQGDLVRQGQRIIELRPTKEKEEVNAAVGNLNVEKARLSEAQAELKAAEADEARVAAEVERARADLAAAEADVEDAKAEVVLAEINYKRAVFLVGEDVFPQQTLDDRTRDLDTRQAQLEAEIKTRDAAKESLNASIKSLQVAQRRVEQALANVDSQKASVARAQGELGSISEDLSFNFLLAPIDGVVGDFIRNKVGDFVSIGEVITTITDNKTFNLNVNIPTEFRSQLRLGLPVNIVNPDGSIGITGRVTYIAPLVDQSTQSILTKITFRNDGSLRDRQYVQVRVIWKKNPGLLVPTTAITSLGGQRFVFVAQEGESKDGEPTLVAKQKPVKVGSIQGQAYQVISGIKAGDRVAVNRILDLKDGTPITEESLKSQQATE